MKPKNPYRIRKLERFARTPGFRIEMSGQKHFLVHHKMFPPYSFFISLFMSNISLMLATHANGRFSFNIFSSNGGKARQAKRLAAFPLSFCYEFKFLEVQIAVHF